MKLVCDWCGTEFEKPPSSVAEHNFCSKECRDRFRGCYTEEEEKFLEENYLDYTDKELAERLGRSQKSIRNKRQRMGLIKTFS